MTHQVEKFLDKCSMVQTHWGNHYPDRREFKWVDVDGGRKPCYEIINGNGLALTVLTPSAMNELAWLNTMRLIAVLAANDAKYGVLDRFNDVFETHVNINEECNPYRTNAYTQASNYPMPKEGDAMMDAMRDLYVIAFHEMKRAAIGALLG